MTTDFRALCAELLTWAERTSAYYVVPPHVILRARAALSAPEQGPTDEEIMELMPQQLQEDLATVSRLAAHGAGPDVGPGLFRVTLNAGAVAHCRAVLARWGRPAVDATNEEWFANFSKWLAREMPEGTVICDPGWWAPRIAAELLTIAADLKEVEPVPVSEWHEDIGNVLWWRFPIEEPPYVGSPLDTDWPGYHTHFTLLPVPQEAKQ